jgi:N-methylhydantoinase B
LQNGEEGAAGKATVFEAGSAEGRELPGKCSLELKAGDVLRLESPGGGGWGISRAKVEDRPDELTAGEPQTQREPAQQDPN